MASDRDQRDRAYLEGLGGAVAALSSRYEPVLYRTRAALGQGFAALRDLARLSRADVAHALGIDEQRLADFESGSIVFRRTT